MQTEKLSKWIWGAKAIAAAINQTERQTYHLLETGKLPARKFGGRWAADEDVLRAAPKPVEEVDNAI